MLIFLFVSKKASTKMINTITNDRPAPTMQHAFYVVRWTCEPVYGRMFVDHFEALAFASDRTLEHRPAAVEIIYL